MEQDCPADVACLALHPAFDTEHPEIHMDTTTLVIVLVIIVVIGGGWFGRGRWY